MSAVTLPAPSSTPLPTRIPVNEPDLSGNEEKYVLDAVRSGWISGGRYLTQFEEGMARFTDTRFGISTVSGTAALSLSVAALGIGPGDEVIVPALTIAATVFAICHAGATPVLVDSEPDTGNMDPEQTLARITPQTKAIMPVHLYGHPVDMGPIVGAAHRNGISIIEDAAEAHGAHYRGRPAGGLGDLGCFSFYGNKVITTGEGGMIVTNDEALAEKLRGLKDLCHSPERRFLHTEVGYTLRMTNLQAAIGVAQLERAEEFVQRKRWMAETYGHLLRGIEGLELPIEKPWARSVYWMYAVRVTPDFGCSRDELMQRLKAKGVDTRSFFIPMHVQPAFNKRGLFLDERYPIAERLGEQGFYLPSGLTITEDQMVRVAEAVREVQREVRG